MTTLLQGGPIILFDGFCNLCRASVRFVVARDPGDTFRFAPLQGRIAAEVLDAGRGCRDREGLESIVLLEDGRVYTRSTAALRIVRRLAGPYRLLYGLIVIPRFARDRVYEFVARRRYRWFGRRDRCTVPTKDEAHRFLD